MQSTSKARLLCSAVLLLIAVAGRHSLDVGLNDGWTIRNANGSIQLHDQSLPSGVFTALEAANLTGSLLYGYNDVRLRWIANDEWTYSLQFDADKEWPLSSVLNECVLVFHGIDTIAQVSLNNHTLSPSPQNMFVRYRYDVCALLSPLANNLTVHFTPPARAAKARAAASPPTPPACPPARYNGECHANQLRKMQASFAWDWGLAAPSMGLWKPVVLELYAVARIRDVAYGLRLANWTHWTADVAVYLECGTKVGRTVEGIIELYMPTVFAEPMRWRVDGTVSGTDGELVVRRSFTVQRDAVDVWWTNGLGGQPLYELRVRWETNTNDVRRNEIQAVAGGGYAMSERTVWVGFRTLELVEEVIDNGHTFQFRLNDIDVFMKGSNWITSHILPERANDAATIDHLLTSAAAVHMNMLRVWGGGLYESDEFYARANRLGILIWQDMMFACAMYPVDGEFLANVALEVRQNVRRLQAHPSIALWAGNNENEAALVQNWYGTNGEMKRFQYEYRRLYADVMRPVLMENDPGRPWLYSSPSNGPMRANQSLIQVDPQNAHYGDIHHYDYVLDGWDPNVYPRPRFASEYGFQSYPSLPAWRTIQPPNADLLELMNHRQHFPTGDAPILLLLRRHLPLPERSDPAYAEALPFMSQLSQAMVTRRETEVYRIGRSMPAVRTMGALYWQLNDVWVAPSWSSIEHGGNHKILHHWAREFLAPIALVAHMNRTVRRLQVHVVRDTLGDSQVYGLVVQTFGWDSMEATRSEWMRCVVPGNTVLQVADIPAERVVEGPQSFVRVQLFDGANRTVATSYVFPGSLKDAAAGIRRDPELRVTLVGHVFNADGGGASTVDVRLSVRYPTAFVYVTVLHAAVRTYQLSDNGFVMVGQSQLERTVRLSFANPGCAVELRASDLRVQTLNEYQSDGMRKL